MAWETRRGRAYYYRKERDGDRVRSVYIGAASELTNAIEMLTGYCRETERLEREEQRASEKEQRQKLDELDKLGRNAEKETTAIVSAYLTASGYHYHRGQWRKRK